MITEKAHAKINLFLHITGKRQDGMHEMQSLAIFPQVYDTVTVKRASDLSLEITGPFADDLWKAADIEDNLVIKAARLVQGALGKDRGAAITLDKQLPVASGLGGGSADAAAALRALMQHWNYHPDITTVRAIAAQLGADVPVCLASQPAIMRGIGTQLSLPPRVPYMHMLLVNPGKPVSTKKVFEGLNWRSAAKKGEVKLPKDFGTVRKHGNFLSKCRNDLEPVAVRLQPEIKTVIKALEGQDGCLVSRMSGSGASCFAIFKSQATARAAYEALSAEHPNWWIKATTS
ncbi:MAG: 4-(cytidine 5'-diphospho)-2-C-methyl-D-erythritol kinase [Alphaproteobacteria bacterium]|nr:MAG: 4-(cytidine 5'-diphospho)-2-C-methyl-D-erythritol kinase [Alphaproteobacteria bacterium]